MAVVCKKIWDCAEDSFLISNNWHDRKHCEKNTEIHVSESESDSDELDSEQAMVPLHLYSLRMKYNF